MPNNLVLVLVITQCGKYFSLNQSRFDYGDVVEGLPPCKACEKAKETARRQAEVPESLSLKDTSQLTVLEK